MAEEEEKFYKAPEQGNGEETEEEIKQDIEEGKKEETIYNREARELELEEEEIEPWEEGFVEGEEPEGEKLAECANCGKPLTDIEETFETEIDGKLYRFCSEECLENFAKSQEELSEEELEEETEEFSSFEEE